MKALRLTILLSMLAAACGGADTGPSADAGGGPPVDAGDVASDAGASRDAALPADGAATLDAALPDAGPAIDAGASRDATTRDASPPIDAGRVPDAGMARDAAVPPPDAGMIATDAGPMNGVPANPMLDRSVMSPQPAGTSVVWMASATDPENDPLVYRFWVTGPSTGNQQMVARDWGPQPTWTWATGGVTPGMYTVTVWIRDGRHAANTGFDAMDQGLFELTPNATCTITGTAGAMLGLGSASDIAARRAQMVQLIWSGAGFPASRLPDNVERMWADMDYADLANLASIDRLTVTMRYGVVSYAYHFRPVTGNGRLFVYHEGHDGNFILGKETIRYFLGRGYGVLAFDMPLYGNNNNPSVTLPNGNTVFLFNHNELMNLEEPAWSPLSYFFDPVAAGINWALGQGYTAVYLVGISGGGWTVTVYAALDPRVQRTYPVAGTLPNYLRIPEDLGDYEQIQPSLYAIANYLELYLMGTAGMGRRQYQVLNRFDSCCYRTELIEPDIVSYRNALNQKLTCLMTGGTYEVAFDASHMMHLISPYTLGVIGADLPP